jgi:hypothetical protein
MTMGTEGLAAFAACSAISGPFATSTSAFRGDHLVRSGERLRQSLVDATIFDDKILAFGEPELMQFGYEDLIENRRS